MNWPSKEKLLWLFRALLILSLVLYIPLSYFLDRQNSALFDAVYRSDIAGAKHAINAGADVNMPIRRNSTLLHVLALRSDDTELAKYLIIMGVPPDKADGDGQTALTCAIDTKHHKMAEFLSHEIAKRDSRDARTNPPK